jgi:hypothetical protein
MNIDDSLLLTPKMDGNKSCADTSLVYVRVPKTNKPCEVPERDLETKLKAPCRILIDLSLYFFSFADNVAALEVQPATTPIDKSLICLAQSIDGDWNLW